MTPVHSDHAALLREAFAAREAGLESDARIGRARLTAAMAQTPTRQANAWVPALSGLAAAALIGGAAFVHFQDRVPARSAPTPAPVQTAAIAIPATERPIPTPVVNAPAALQTPAPAPAAIQTTRNPDAGSTTWVPISETRTVEPASAPLEVRLAKSSGGILVRWDGPASARQYELRKSCVDFRSPGHAVEAGRVRLNEGAWLDTAPDSCGNAATQYEVAEVSAT